eukprot:10298889-Prorocentrum_lima.AAC.1
MTQLNLCDMWDSGASPVIQRVPQEQGRHWSDWQLETLRQYIGTMKCFARSVKRHSYQPPE